MKYWLLSTIILGGVMYSMPALSTYSIVACDKNTNECGVAVATNNLAVGSSVAYAEVGIGALVTQFETNPNYGPKGIALLAKELKPATVLKQLLAEDNNFEGQGIEMRQIAIVNRSGDATAYTGEVALNSHWAGSRYGKGYSVQGNGLANQQVLIEMEKSFVTQKGTLAERLLKALEAGKKAGGQTIGEMSAALIVRTNEGWPIDIDLRVDAHTTPVNELRRLLNLRNAHQLIIAAERHARNKNFERSEKMLVKAVKLGWTWDRILRRAARLSATLNQSEKSIKYLTRFVELNPTWATIELSDPIYRSLEQNGELVVLHHRLKVK